MIGETEVKVIDMGGGRVRLGIDAPPDVRILRSELVAVADEWLRPVECGDERDQT